MMEEETVLCTIEKLDENVAKVAIDKFLQMALGEKYKDIKVSINEAKRYSFWNGEYEDAITITVETKPTRENDLKGYKSVINEIYTQDNVDLLNGDLSNIVERKCQVTGEKEQRTCIVDRFNYKVQFYVSLKNGNYSPRSVDYDTSSEAWKKFMEMF